MTHSAVLAVREKAKNWRKHWTASRSNAAHATAFAVPVSEKSEGRKGRRAVLRARYEAFFGTQTTEELAAFCADPNRDARKYRDRVLSERRSAPQREAK
jgi:hypothetical protein